MDKGVVILGSDQAALMAALVLARACVPVSVITDGIVLGGSGECAPPLNAPAAFRPQLPLELEVVRDPNVTVHYGTHIKGVGETGGGLELTLERQPRYVDEELCSGCGKCEEACPVEIEGRRAIYSFGRTRVPSIYTVQKRGEPPCRSECPAGVNAQGYIALVRAGKFREALELEREANPFAGVCGRVCQRPCETQCYRGHIDSAVAIRDLKRFIAEYDYKDRKEVRKREKSPGGPRVAVIGAGPAGLTCARDLDRLGYRVTIMEARRELGGMLSWAIPAFRLPRKIVKSDLDYILSPSITVQKGRQLGRDFTIEDLRREGYEAIFLGIGAQTGLDLEIAGKANAEAIASGLHFLQKVEDYECVEVKGEVLVIGGGNAAMDAARVSLRLGASKVTIVYRRTRNEMPALCEEVDQAVEEGIVIEELTSPVEFICEDNTLKGLKVIRNKLGRPDESGRARPVPIPGSETVMPCHLVIASLGQKVDLSSVEESGIELTRYGTIKVDKKTYQTSLKGVFAGGDAVTGAATVIAAVGAGRKAARGIHSYLQGGTPIPEEPQKQDITAERHQELRLRAKDIPRTHPPCTALSERVCSFNEVEGCFSPEDARREAERCLNCGDCSLCMECERICSEVKAIRHSQKNDLFTLNASTLIAASDQDAAVTGVKGRAADLSPADRKAEKVIRVAAADSTPSEEHLAILKGLLAAIFPHGFTEDTPPSAIVKAYQAVCAAGRATLNSLQSPAVRLDGKAIIANPSAEQPRIGIFLCYCGGSMEKAMKGLGEYGSTLPDVVFSEEIPDLCEQGSLEKIKKRIRDQKLNRVVLGGCACCALDQICEGCTYQRVRAKRRFIENLGLDIPFMELCNLRELGAWVQEDPDAGAREKMKSLIAMAVERLGAGGRHHYIEIERERSVLLFDLGKDTQAAASMLNAAGYMPILYLSRVPAPMQESLKDSILLRDKIREIRWEKGNFLVLCEGPGEKLLKVGAIISPRTPSELDPFISSALTHPAGFPGVFLIRDAARLPEKLRSRLPLFLTATVSAYLAKGRVRRLVSRFHVDERLCRECGRCLEICPYAFISKESGARPAFNLELCQNCGLCAMVCNTNSLQTAASSMKEVERVLDCVLCRR